MNMDSLLILLIIGAVTGWLAGRLMTGGGYGLPGNIVVGIIGGIVGGFLCRLLVIAAGGLIGSMMTGCYGSHRVDLCDRIRKKRNNN